MKRIKKLLIITLCCILTITPIIGSNTPEIPSWEHEDDEPQKDA